MENKRSAEEILRELRAKKREDRREIETEYNKLGEKLDRANVTDVHEVEDKTDSRTFIENYFGTTAQTDEQRRRESEALDRLHRMLTAADEDTERVTEEIEEEIQREEEEELRAEETEEENRGAVHKHAVFAFSNPAPEETFAGEDTQEIHPIPEPEEPVELELTEEPEEVPEIREEEKPEKKKHGFFASFFARRFDGEEEETEETEQEIVQKEIRPYGEEDEPVAKTEQTPLGEAPEAPVEKPAAHVHFTTFEPIKPAAVPASRELQNDAEPPAEERDGAEELPAKTEPAAEAEVPVEEQPVSAPEPVSDPVAEETGVDTEKTAEDTETVSPAEERSLIAEKIAASVREKTEREYEGIPMPPAGEDGEEIGLFFGRKKKDRGEEDSPEETDEWIPSPEEQDAWIARTKLSTLARTAVTGILAVLALALDLLQGSALLPAPLQSSVQPMIYLVTNVVLLCVAVLFTMTYLVDGIRSLAAGRPTADSAVAVPVLLLFFFTCITGLDLTGIAFGKVHIYVTGAIAALFFTALARCLWIRWADKELGYLAQPGDKKVLSLTRRETVCREASRALKFNVETVGLHRACSPQEDELRRLYIIGDSQKIYGILALLIPVLSVLAAGLVWFTTGSPVNGFGAGAALIAVSLPTSLSVGSVLSMRRESRRLRRYGAVLMGIDQAKATWESDAVVCRDTDICPPGSVGVATIKTFGDGRIDEVIIYAASISRALDNALWPLFDQIIQSNEKLLLPVESVHCDPDSGVESFVNSKRISLGNREQLARCGMDIPSKDYEEKYCPPDCCAMYLAVSGEIQAMFILQYTVPKEVLEHLDPVFRNGISLLVNSSDPNITDEMLRRILHGEESDAAVLSGNMREAVRAVPEDAHAPIVHRGSFMSALAAVRSCGRVLRTMGIGRMLQLVGSVSGLLLAAVSCITFGGAQLSGLFAVLYTMGWTGAILVLQQLL